MRMRPVLYATGLMTAALGLAMLAPALMDIADGAPDWRAFALPGILATAIGSSLSIASYQKNARIPVHETFLLTVMVWIILAIVASTPFLLTGMSFTDSMFESMSGLTTTGATVITGLDSMPRGLLLWRALLQWIGGIGIIVTAIAVLPMLKLGGMQLFQLESSDASGKFLPRVSEIASQTTLIYLALTLACAFLYAASGMSLFNATAHAMTTVSAGGFSTSDQSFAAFSSNNADLTAMLFMILAALPFGLMVLAVRGNPKPLLSDPQPRMFLILAACSVIAISASLWINSAEPPEPLIRNAAFNTISILTGTGYATRDYSLWGPFASSLFLILMFCGGCAGSAACGMKTFRIHISALAMISHIRALARPGRIVPVRYGEKIINPETIQSIELFMSLYLASFFLIACSLALLKLDPETALSAAAACLGNVGPGLGNTIGPNNHYGPLPNPAKWVCLIAMLLGRLELIAAFVLLSPRYWQR